MNLGLIAYADSDFANRLNKLNPEDANSLFSRTGYVIFLWECLLYGAVSFNRE